MAADNHNNRNNDASNINIIRPPAVQGAACSWRRGPGVGVAAEAEANLSLSIYIYNSLSL